MHLYRFRLLFEEQDDFLRDFDILATQTFLDFHNLIVESVELKGNELASFFLCDRNWRKKKEITLIDMQQNDEDQTLGLDDDDEKANARLNKIPIFEMAKVKIKDVIDDPHQRLLFEYDFLNPKSFYIELMKIIDADVNEKYPRCSKSVGKLMPSAIASLPFIAEDASEIPLPGEFDEITQTDDDNENDDFIVDTSAELDKEW